MEPVTDVEQTPSPITPSDEQLWSVLNGIAMPLWAAMIVAPRSRFTAALMRRSGIWFAGLSAAYVVQLIRTASSSGPPESVSLETMLRSMSEPRGFLTGWTHFLAFDLFVGRWIWERSLAEGRSARLALVMTLMTGPAGLLVYAAQRRSFAMS